MKKKVYNENYFEKIDSEDKAYFLGLIYSDGCIVNNQDEYRYKITLKLHIKDKHILEDFIKSVSGEMSLWFHGQRDICEVNLSGKKIVKDLEEKGLHPNKTFTIKYPEISEELERHFLRGYFDGDGCITCGIREPKPIELQTSKDCKKPRVTYSFQIDSKTITIINDMITFFKKFNINLNYNYLKRDDMHRI